MALRCELGRRIDAVCIEDRFGVSYASELWFCESVRIIILWVGAYVLIWWLSEVGFCSFLQRPLKTHLFPQLTAYLPWTIQWTDLERSDEHYRI